MPHKTSYFVYLRSKKEKNMTPYLPNGTSNSVEISVPWMIIAFCIIVIVFIVQELRIRKDVDVKHENTKKEILDIVRNIPITSSGEGVIISHQLNHSNMPRNQSYRIEEEQSKKSSSEYTRRGQLWSKHASWNLPKAPRFSNGSSGNWLDTHFQGLEHVHAILSKFDVDPRRGFLPSQDPLQRLPCARYHLWEDLGTFYYMNDTIRSRTLIAIIIMMKIVIILTIKYITF